MARLRHFFILTISVTVFMIIMVSFRERPSVSEIPQFISMESRSPSGVRCLDTPFDAVLTWVNGSDPEFIKIKSKYLTQGVASEAMRARRYTDWGTLRYSIRSMGMYAPWIRKIYLVTNGQVPDWLKPGDGLELITHDQLFDNKSSLPTFNSNAIEAHIHKIPGLADKFVYLNDDVMFGNNVTKEDFCYGENGQIIYTSWYINQCAAGCKTDWVGDGKCNKPCNVTECLFDKGDCSNPDAKVYKQTVGAGNEPWRQCLHYTNQIFNREYGYAKTRPSPTHSVHFFDRIVKGEFVERFSELVKNTSERRFRTRYDANVEFTYYTFIVEEELERLQKKVFQDADTDCRKIDCANLRTFMNQYTKELARPRYQYKLLPDNKYVMFMALKDDVDAQEKWFNNIKYGTMKKFLCLNDHTAIEEKDKIERMKKVVDKFFDRVLPIKSKFEK